MDSLDHDPGEAFSIPDLWGPSRLLESELDHTSYLFSELKFNDIDERRLEAIQIPRSSDQFFTLPDLSPGLLSEDITLSHSLEALDNVNDVAVPNISAVDDVWLLPEEISVKVANYLSWDFFGNGIEDAQSPYATEAGPIIFDLIAANGENGLRLGNNGKQVLETNVFISSLVALGLGRSSVLFGWDEEKKVFTPVIPLMRISGYTFESVQGLTDVFLDCGNMTRALKKFVEDTYNENQSPGRIALADAVSTLLTTIQAELRNSLLAQKSVLQLQASFQPARSILACFQRLIAQVTTTHSDESMLSALFKEIQLLEHRTGSLKYIFYEILARVSKPWLEFASEWVGIQRENGLPMTTKGSGRSFVQLDNKDWIDDQGLDLHGLDYVLDHNRIPSFLAPEDAQMLFETGKNLRFLRQHHPEHPLAKADIVAFASPPTLAWKFSWHDINQVEAKALEYERDLRAAIQRFSTQTSTTVLNQPISYPYHGVAKLDFFGKPEEDMQAHLLASIETLNQPLVQSLPDPLSVKIKKHLSNSSESFPANESVFAPPIHLASLLSFNPVISAQARAVNLISLRMFFNSHKLREHLSLQRNFQLLGSGVFSSRLSHALFDPELESAERRQGVARSGAVMGLRLGGRDTWPPASSELRLALMGVLTESYVAGQPLQRSRATSYIDSNASLPGDLSFAVRDMSEEEIEQCLNPDSLEALDFLRLSYKPPAPLERVITPIILYKYDRLFRLLLRVVRMLYVVSALFRDTMDRNPRWQAVNSVSQRFRIEAHHFVTNVCGYFFETGIDATWRVFERKLDQIETRINSDDNSATLDQSEGLEKLRDCHERIVDRIMFALLLRKRQKPVMNLLEEIFGLILQFSKYTRHRVLGSQREASTDEEVIELYKQFRKKIGIFITVCKGLSEKKGYGEKKSLDEIGVTYGGLFDEDDLTEENTMFQLVTRLEMSDYYLKPLKV